MRTDLAATHFDAVTRGRLTSPDGTVFVRHSTKTKRRTCDEAIAAGSPLVRYYWAGNELTWLDGDDARQEWAAVRPLLTAYDGAMDLFAGIPVTDFTAVVDWYERLFGTPPSFFPHDTEAVWQLAEHLFVYVVQQPDRAGHAINTLMVDDLDIRLTGTASRGLQPSNQETYGNGVRKITYTDPDGNDISFGGVPV